MQTHEWQREAALILKNGKPTWRYSCAFFREALERERIDEAELARRLHVTKGTASRMLGLRPRQVGIGNSRRMVCATSVSYKNAVKLTRALHLDPTTVGV